MLPTFLNCVGLTPKGPRSLPKLPGIRERQYQPTTSAPQKTRLYLQRASSQHTISMQKHSPTFTMEYMHRQQRSFVAPVLQQICFFSSSSSSFVFFFLSSLRQFCCLLKIWGEAKNEEQHTQKRKERLDLSQSVKKAVGRVCFHHSCAYLWRINQTVQGKKKKSILRQNNKLCCASFDWFRWIC